jgi:hypothetical protein
MTIFRHLPKFLAAIGVAVALAGCGALQPATTPPPYGNSRGSNSGS